MRSILGHIATTTFIAFLMVTGTHAQVVFTDITEEAGIDLTEWLTESVACGDYDNDGDEDLYLTVDGPNHLFRNDGGGRFTDVTEAAGVGNQGFSVGSAFGDLDNDGDLDLVVTADMNEPNRLWRNDSTTSHHWVGLRLRGTKSNRSAIGARVVVTTRPKGRMSRRSAAVRDAVRKTACRSSSVSVRQRWSTSSRSDGRAAPSRRSGAWWSISTSPSTSPMLRFAAAVAAAFRRVTSDQ